MGFQWLSLGLGRPGTSQQQFVWYPSAGVGRPKCFQEPVNTQSYKLQYLRCVLTKCLLTNQQMLVTDD